MNRPQTYADFDQLRVGDYLKVVWRSRFFLVTFCAVAACSALVFSLLAPKIFRATVTLLPPPENEPQVGLGAAAALVSKTSLLVSGMPALTNRQDVLVAILQSRSLAQNIVEKYKLATYYKLDSAREAAAALGNATTVSLSKAGLISVTVEDRDPRIAAELANAYPVELNRLLKRIDVRQTSVKRRFILDRLAETEAQLQMAEDALMRFQESNRAVALQEQAEGVMNIASQLKAQIMATEVELEVARGFATESNPLVVNLRQKIEELKKQLARIQYGGGLDLPGIEETIGVHPQYKEIHLAAANVPKLGIQFARLTRDLKVQESVYSLLTQQLEEAKIAESRDLLAAQVLDSAIPPFHKSRPRTLLNIALAIALSLTLGVMFVFIMEYIDVHGARSQLG